MSTVTPTRALAEALTLPCGAVLPNRIAKSAMSEQLGTLQGSPTEGLIRLYERWGRGGTGLLITGNVMVDPTALGEPRNVVLEDDRDADLLRRWASAAQSGGAQAWMQINHPGRQTPRTLNRHPVAPSAVAMRGLGGMFARPRALTTPEIEEIIRRFATTARLAVEHGFAGVQIHGAHGYLVSQFLSPLANTRSDAYGGTPEKRMRFLLDVFRAIRAEVGSERPIGVKLNSADFQRGGFDEADSMAVVEALEAEGVDLLEISGGTYEAGAMTGEVGLKESTKQREAYFLEYAEKVRERTKAPLMLTGGLRSAQAMDDALSSGAIDVCGIARPLALQTDLSQRLLDDTSAKSTVVPRNAKVAQLRAAAETMWYTHQLWRLADGKEPDPSLGTEQAIAKYLALNTRDGALRLLKRR